MDPISSPQNPRVKLVKQLQSRAKTRRQEARLVLEGARLMADALASGARPEFVFFEAQAAQGGATAELLAALGASAIPCLEVTPALLRDMADTETPQGMLGVFPWPDLPIPDDPALVVVADGWRDPGNLGTLLRTAAAASVDLVALTPGTVDPFNPKVVRAGMGAHFRVPVAWLAWDELAAHYPQHAVYLADAHGEVVFDAVDWTQPSLLVIGGEAHGFQAEARRIPHTTIHIPMAPGAESLNAAVAASILILAARRHAL